MSNDMKKVEDIMDGKKSVKVGGQDVVLDTGKLKFNEATLSKYLEEEAGWYDYYGQKLADAELFYQGCDLEYEAAFAEKFKTFKEEDGGSDKLVESRCKADPDLKALRMKTLAAKNVVKLLQQHLRAWDKNHDNAQSRGHMLRKEIDKLNAEIYLKTGGKSLDAQIDEIVKGSQA